MYKSITLKILVFLSLLVMIFFIYRFDFIKNTGFKFVQERYQRIYETRNINLNSRYSERLEQFRLFPTSATNLMLGDSLTHFGEWGAIFPDYSVLNRGIGWDQTVDIIHRLDNVFSANPKQVFIMAGFNDLYHSKRKVSKVFNDYVQIIGEIRNRNIEVIVQSTLKCLDCGRLNQEIDKLNRLLYLYSKSREIVFIDLNVILDETDVVKYYKKDGVHLNAEGYRLWSNIIEPYLK